MEYGINIAGPATGVVAVTPSDATVYSPPLRSLYVGSNGLNVTIVDQYDTQVTFTAVPAGYLFVFCKKVMSTGTTATNIVGLY